MINPWDSDGVSKAQQPPPPKVPAMRAYKNNLKYDSAWKKTYPWIEYDTSNQGMLCSICKEHGKVPVQARGAWVTRPVNNWVKAHLC